MPAFSTKLRPRARVCVQCLFCRAADSHACATMRHGSGGACLEWRRCTLISQRSEEHTSELQSLMRISYAVFCLKKKKYTKSIHHTKHIKFKNKTTISEVPHHHTEQHNT